jgi:AsmA protein
MPRLILVPLVLIVLLVLMAVVAVPLLVDKEALLELATKTLHEQTGATLAIAGETEIILFPTLGISLSSAAVTLPEKSEPDLRVRSAEIGVQLLPLITGRVEIDTIRLDGLVVRIESSTNQPGGQSAQPDIAGNAGAALAVPLALNVKRLLVTNARLEEVSPMATATVMELVKLEATGLNLEQKPIPIELKIRRPGEQPVEISLQGNIRVDQQTQRINLDAVTVQISGATAQPVKVKTSGSVDLAREVADLRLALESGEAHGEGSLRYASSESPVIDARLQLNLFDPALLVLAGPEAAAVAKRNSASTSADEPLPLEALRQIDTHAIVDIEKARFDAHTVNSLHVEVRAREGVVQVTELTGELHGGKLDAIATLDGRGDKATLETSGTLDRLDIANALAATESSPVLNGKANLSWQLGSVGRTTKELTATLNGPVKLTTEEVVLQGTSVEKLLCEAVALTNQEQLTAAFPADTRVETLTADIQVAHGKAALDPLRAELPQVTLIGSGSFDLLEEDFDVTFKARLSPQLEQLDHACRVSKRLTAIDWPVNCAGNVDTKPAKWCRVDTAKILQDLTVNEGRETLEKKASKLLNKLFNRGN